MVDVSVVHNFPAKMDDADVCHVQAVEAEEVVVVHRDHEDCEEGQGGQGGDHGVEGDDHGDVRKVAEIETLYQPSLAQSSTIFRDALGYQSASFL